jgi:hypothetical protein
VREVRELTREEAAGRLDWYCAGSLLAADAVNFVLVLGGGIALYEDGAGGWMVLAFGIAGAHASAATLPGRVPDADDGSVLLPLAGIYQGEPLPLQATARG